MPTDKAAAVKVSRKITTQHRPLIFHEIFTKDNTEPNQHHEDVTQIVTIKLHCVFCTVESFSFKPTQSYKSF